MILYRLTGSDLWYEIVRFWRRKKAHTERTNEARNVYSNWMWTEGDRNGNDNGDDKEINRVNWFLNGQTFFRWAHAVDSICRFVDENRFSAFSLSLSLCFFSVSPFRMAACCFATFYPFLCASLGCRVRAWIHLFHIFFVYSTNEHRALMTFETKRMNEMEN